MQGPADDSEAPSEEKTPKGGEEAGVHRLRLLEGLATAVSERGYASTTIADIVKNARVSKRTFYEHFADKEECFVALYGEANEILRTGIEQAFHSPGAWEKQLEAGLEVYLGALAANPALTRACLLEIQAAGPRALEMRLRSHAKFARMLRSFVERTREDHPHLRPLSAPMATAVVGGIDELLLVSVQRSANIPLTELRQTAIELMRSVLGLPLD